MDYESFLELVKGRRSTHAYKPDPVPDDSVDKIIEAARWAPSGANSQPWEFIIIKKNDLRERIVEFFKEQHEISYKMEQTRAPEQRFPTYRNPPQGTPGFANAPVLIVVCGDPRTKEAYPLKAKLDRGASNFYSSLASAFLYMHLAATALGLGSQWVSASGLDLMQGRLKEFLAIPYGFEIYDMMALGYVAHEAKPRKVRSREEIVHLDKFDMARFRTQQQVRDFIDGLWKR
ncbi:MAG: nitroreductase family protein [Pseudomonadota bacterium]